MAAEARVSSPREAFFPPTVGMSESEMSSNQRTLAEDGSGPSGNGLVAVEVAAGWERVSVAIFLEISDLSLQKKLPKRCLFGRAPAERQLLVLRVATEVGAKRLCQKLGKQCGAARLIRRGARRLDAGRRRQSLKYSLHPWKNNTACSLAGGELGLWGRESVRCGWLRRPRLLGWISRRQPECQSLERVMKKFTERGGKIRGGSQNELRRECVRWRGPSCWVNPKRETCSHVSGQEPQKSQWRGL
jgi:hypothetical protein